VVHRLLGGEEDAHPRPEHDEMMPAFTDDLVAVAGPNATNRPARFYERAAGKERRVILAASTVAIVAIAAVVIVALLALIYILPRGGRRRR
jgi:hypothetical protein